MRERIKELRSVLSAYRYEVIVLIIIVAFVSAEIGYHWPTVQPVKIETEIIICPETFVDLNTTNMGRTYFQRHTDTILNATIEWSATNRVIVAACWHVNEYCYDFSHGTVDNEWHYGGFAFRQVGISGFMYLGPDYFAITKGEYWSFTWNSQFIYGGEMYYYGRVNMTYTVTLTIERVK